MTRVLTALLTLCLLAAPAATQDVAVLLQDTPLYERPTLEAASSTTLPAGIRLELTGREGEWLIVTTSEGLVGWIPRRAAHVETVGAPPPTEPDPLPSPAAAADTDAGALVPETQGFFNRRKRSAISFTTGTLSSSSQIDDAGTRKSVDLSWGSLAGSRFEWGGYVLGSKYDVSALEPWYDLEVGAKLNLFLLQPNGTNPLGLYLGGLLAWTQFYLGKNSTSNVSTLTWGGDGGVYLKLGSNPLVVPRAIYRFESASYLGEDRPPGAAVSSGVALDGTRSSFLTGVDVAFGSFVPGLWLTFRDGSSLLTIRATIAY